MFLSRVGKVCGRVLGQMDLKQFSLKNGTLVLGRLREVDICLEIFSLSVLNLQTT